MRIGFDVGHTCHQRAGCAWHAEALARALSEELTDHDELLLYHHFGNWIPASTTGGLRLPGVAMPTVDLSETEARQLWQSVENGAAPPPGDPDIVHSNSFMAPRAGRAPLVYTVHDLCFLTHPEYTTEGNRLLCLRQFLRALGRAAAFLFVSEQSRDDFERLFPKWLANSGKRWRVIPSASRLQPANPVDAPARFQDPDAPWLHVGSIEPRKGIDRLLDAYLRYHQQSGIKRPLRLLGGRGQISEPLHRRIEQLSTSLPVRYEGYVADKDLPQAYQNAFGFICLSHYEGFGLPTAEAAAHGLPLVCSDIPSFRPFRVATDFYRQLQEQDPAKAMLELERNEPVYCATSSQTRAIAQSRTYRHVAQETLAFYHDILA